MWTRIRIDFGLDQDPIWKADPDRVGKNDPQMNKVRKCIVLKWMFSFGELDAYSVAWTLDILPEGLEDKNSDIFDHKNMNFCQLQSLQFFVIKSLDHDPDLDPNPHLPKTLDQDLHYGFDADP